MASLGHILFGMAVARAHANRTLTGDEPRALVTSTRAPLVATAAFAALAMLPDADIIAFHLHIPYGDPLGHRGASHSLVAALVVGSVLGAILSRVLRAPLAWTVVAAVVAVMSHGLFDMLTDGGKGVGLFWPFSSERYFFPFTPIPVAPIGARFLSLRGLYCAVTELVLFSPFLWFALRVRRPPG